MYDVFYRAMLDYPDLAIAAHGMIQSRKPGAATLLEVACGTGLYLEEFSKWYEVVGLDSSADMLAVARDRVPDGAFQQGDMATFDLGQTFDAVICMFSSIGYVVTIERLESALRRFAAHLNPGGVMIVEPWLSPDVWRDDHIGAASAVDSDLAVARTSTSVRDGRKVVMHWGFAVARPDGGTETYIEEHPTGLFTHAEYSAALRAAGIVFDYDPEGLLGRGRYVGVKPTLV